MVMGQLRRVWNSLRRRRFTSDQERWIEISLSGFKLLSRCGCVGEVNWNDVGEIVVYKTDDYTVDTVWLEFGLSSQHSVFAVNDENKGFWDLVAEVKRVFPDSRQDWESAVLKPAFTENWTPIFRR